MYFRPIKQHEKLKFVREISGCHGDKYEDDYLPGCLRCVSWYKFADISEVLPTSIVGLIAISDGPRNSFIQLFQRTKMESEP
jgi:hypothetical protein